MLFRLMSYAAADRSSEDLAVTIGYASRDNVFSVGPVKEIRAHEREHLWAERDRLLYVAATRARDHLLISLYHHRTRATQSGAARLVACGAAAAATPLPEINGVIDQRPAPFAGLVVTLDDGPESEFDGRRASLLAATRSSPVTSATALKELRALGSGGPSGAHGGERDEPETADEDEREDESEPWARGRAGTHRGRAVHAALQVLPWDASAEMLDAIARAQSVAEAIPDEANRVAELLRRALATGAAGRAQTARRAQREVPFAFVEDGVTVEGFIDLVIEDGDGLEVVDWKTDAVTAGSVTRRLGDYTLQAGLYVLALEAATGLSVRRVTYVFVDPNVEASPGEPAELAAQARTHLAEQAARQAI